MRRIHLIALGGVVLAGLLAGVLYFSGNSVGSLLGATSTPSAREKVKPPPGYVEYVNERYTFSLWHPPDLQVQEYAEENGNYSVSFQNPETGYGFQVFISAYGGEEITRERFLIDVPSGKMEEPTDIYIDDAPATMFFSENGLLGETREVWFIKGEYLYEVVTYKELDAWLSQIMTTWRFL